MMASEPAGAVFASSAASPSSVSEPVRTQQGIPLHAAKLGSNYDAIVIGSGLGGLTAAVGLAKFGRQQVLVLEQHTTAGGSTQAFKRGKFSWNVGLHYVGGGVGERGGMAFAPFNAFTDGKVAWAKLPDVHDRLMVGDRVYDIVTGRDAWLDKMTAYFPEERQALLKFLDLVSAAEKAFKRASSTWGLPWWLSKLLDPFLSKEWVGLAAQSLAEVLNSITHDKELRAVLAGSWPDLGLTPERCSAGYYLCAYGSYLEGAFTTVGTASSIAAAMIPVIEAAGGAVVTSADVAQVLVEGGRAVGVRLADGREIRSNVMISNAGLVNTYNKLLPPDTLSASPQMQQRLQQAAASGTSLAVVVLYLGLNESLVPEFQGFGTLRVYPSADHDGNCDRYMADLDAPSPIIEICCHDGREHIMTDNPAGAAAAAAAAAASSSSSSNKGSGGVSTIQVIAGANYSWFEEWTGTKWHQRGEGYEAFKQKLQAKLMQRLGELFPDLPSRVVRSELSTPLSTEHFARWPRGGIYGINASPERYKLTNGRSWGPATPLPGLLLTGQDVVGDGILPAFLSGTFTAQLAGGPMVGLRMMQEIWKWK